MKKVVIIYNIFYYLYVEKFKDEKCYTKTILSILQFIYKI